MKPTVLGFAWSRPPFLTRAGLPLLLGPRFHERKSKSQGSRALCSGDRLGAEGRIHCIPEVDSLPPKTLRWGWNSAQAFQGAVPESWPWMILSGPAQGCSPSRGPQSSLSCSMLISKHGSAIWRWEREF